jgi:hypothetical protein
MVVMIVIGAKSTATVLVNPTFDLVDYNSMMLAFVRPILVHLPEVATAVYSTVCFAGPILAEVVAVNSKLILAEVVPICSN